MNTIYWIALAVMIVPTVFGIGWIIFRSWRGFRESVWFEFIPDFISLFRGELKRDWLAEMKLALFVVSSLIAAAYEKKLLDSIFDHYK